MSKKNIDIKKINRALSKGFRELDKAYVNLLGSEEQKLVILFRNTLNRVKKRLADVYDNFGDKPTITELRKYNRLKTIEMTIAKDLNELEKEIKTYVSKQSKYSLLTGKADTLKVIGASLSVDFATPVYDKKTIAKYLDDTLWIDSLEVSTAKLFTDIKYQFETVLRANAKEEIVGGAMEGVSIRELTKRIEERFSVSFNRAKTIAWTETHKYYNIGRNDGVEEAIESANKFGLKAYKVWRHTGAAKQPRLDHVDADGTIANDDGMFFVGGEELPAPGLGTDPANNINCHCSVDFVIEDF